jgi:eukaryotic-like serine/threonine-protein kinase
MARLPLPAAEPMKLVPLAEIARGGMGSVELARADGGKFHAQLLAIKRLHPNIAQDPQFVGMFLDEAWMTAALQSPNVVRVAAWGNDDKGMFLAVEFVQGVSLARLIKESQTNKEPFAERSVAYLGSQICAGLSAAHAVRGPDQTLLGLVHRDLTPGNILVSFEGVVKIADFGIAKAEERITHTRTGTLKGKPSYMAPEQARGGKVDLRADLFSFGVLMFELLAGRRPWIAKSAFDVMMEIATSPPPDLRDFRKGLNPDFVQIVQKCLQKKPEERFSTAAEIQQRLDAWRQSKNFTHDDQQSLAQFVVRNSSAQIKWFEEALRGEMRRAQKLTFKELEEQIDLERETTAARNKPRGGVRPAAGKPADELQAPNPGAARDPSNRASAHADLLPPPSRLARPGAGHDSSFARGPSARPPTPAEAQRLSDLGTGSSGNFAAVKPPSQPDHALAARLAPMPGAGGSGKYPVPSGAQPGTGGSGNYAAVQPPSSGQGGPGGSKGLGGTEYMAVSPFPPDHPAGGARAGSVAPADQRSSPRPPIPGTIVMAQQSAPPEPPLARSNLRTVPLSSQPPGVRESHMGYPQNFERPRTDPAPEPARRRRGGSWLIVLLVLLALLGGALYASWYYRLLFFASAAAGALR